MRQCSRTVRPARLRASAAAASLALLLLAGTSPVPAQQLGDFGRMAPGVVNDELFPLFDPNRRGMNGRPLDGFNLTDEEVEMRNRLWRFLVPPYAKDWAVPYRIGFSEVAAGRLGQNHAGKYYDWLTAQRYASSRVRYNTMALHITDDLGTLPAAFRSICAVEAVDRQREIAVVEVRGLEAKMLEAQRRRHDENGLFVARFVAALNFRYLSYSYALDHFLVETPHAEAVAVDTALTALASWRERALAGDFCGGDWNARGGGDAALPGRVLLGAPDEGQYRK